MATNELVSEETVTRVELLENIERALLKRNTTTHVPKDGTEPAKLETYFPTIEEQSHHWTLNEKQHMSFVLMAAALLQHVFSANNETDSLSTDETIKRISRIKDQLEDILPNSKQLLMFLGGCGGTGKSRIIKTFLDFARRWHSASTVVVTATSGIAAMLIGGCTLHSALGIGTKANPPKPSQTLINAWSKIGILIIDEISMMRASFLDLLDTRLRQLKTRLNKIFGGIHLVFCGDFYQLPPVGTSLITSEQLLQNGKKEQLSSLRGQELWVSCLTDVIILEENLRQSDLEWAASLLRWRVNQPTEEDIALINKNVVNSENLNDYDFKQENIPIAVCDNESREKGLRFCERDMLRKQTLNLNEINNWRSHGVLVIQARIRKVEGHQTVQQKHEDYVRSLNSKRLNGAGNLFCVKDARYMITKNQNVTKGVANGTIATLNDVVLKENAAVRVTNLSSQLAYAVYADEVRCLIFKHSLKTWENDNSFPSLAEGCFPLATITKKTMVPLGRNGETFNVKTTLFPCELANVLTGHKMQGQTLHSVTLGNLSARHKYGRTGWIYVVLSRVTTVSGLHLMTPLELNPKKYKPREEIKEEMERLGCLSKLTISRLKKTTACLKL